MQNNLKKNLKTCIGIKHQETISAIGTVMQDVNIICNQIMQVANDLQQSNLKGVHRDLKIIFNVLEFVWS